MNEDERQLLLMVAKDVRRMWRNKPSSFGNTSGWIAGEKRVKDYDIVVHKVEHAEENETDERNGESSS